MSVALPSGSPVPSDPSDVLAELNVQQRAAVEHDGGALLVIAGAGSGKTNTLAWRVANLVMRGADLQRILLMTFSRRAAAEMERRVRQILTRVLRFGPNSAPINLPWTGTFHSIGARLLRDYATRIGISEAFTIHDQSDSQDLMALVRHQLGFSDSKNRFPAKATCLAIYSRVTNTCAPLAQVLTESFPWCSPWAAEMKRLFAAYVCEKQSQAIFDYDDLLLYWAAMVAEPTLRGEIAARFDHILVDEYQDTNRLQASILYALKPDGSGLTVVGDDAQAIYSFRAATVRNILEFPAQFRPEARVVTLERNYRSTEPILMASNAVIGLARERYAKNLWTERASHVKPRLVSVGDEAEQARYIAEQVLAYRESGATLKAQAVLFRTSSHSALLEIELSRRDIPFVKYGGLKFLEAAHVKDILSVLRWAQNPRARVAGFRVAQLLPGIGPANASKLLDLMGSAADPVLALETFVAPAAAAVDWAEFRATYLQLCRFSRWPGDLEQVWRWYAPHLERIYEAADVRKQDLEQLCRIAASYGTRERFLTELTLDPPQATSDEAGVPKKDDDFLVLSTIHSAKGQEWKAVYILNVIDGCIPSDMSTGSTEEIEEERRLLYVAMTRARQDLHLLVPQRFYVHQQVVNGDRHVYASRSRFIPEAVAVHFERVGWPVPDIVARPVPKIGARATLDLGARIRQTWD